jgi:hypothetical protein
MRGRMQGRSFTAISINIDTIGKHLTPAFSGTLTPWLRGADRELFFQQQPGLNQSQFALP